jgi:hypothetical protein
LWGISTAPILLNGGILNGSLFYASSIDLIETGLQIHWRCIGPTGSIDLTESSVGARAVILKSETYNFHRLDLTRQAGFIVTIYDEDGLRLAATMPCSTPAEAFAAARRIVDNRVEGPSK